MITVSYMLHEFISTARNIDRGLSFAQSLRTKVEASFKKTKTAEKRIKRLSLTLEGSTSDSADRKL